MIKDYFLVNRKEQKKTHKTINTRLVSSIPSYILYGNNQWQPYICHILGGIKLAPLSSSATTSCGWFSPMSGVNSLCLGNATQVARLVQWLLVNGSSQINSLQWLNSITNFSEILIKNNDFLSGKFTLKRHLQTVRNFAQATVWSQAISGLILGLRPYNEKHHYKVTPSLIGCVQT